MFAAVGSDKPAHQDQNDRFFFVDFREVDRRAGGIDQFKIGSICENSQFVCHVGYVFLGLKLNRNPSPLGLVFKEIIHRLEKRGGAFLVGKMPAGRDDHQFRAGNIPGEAHAQIGGNDAVVIARDHQHGHF